MIWSTEMAISFFNKTQRSASEVLGEAITAIAKAQDDIQKYKSMKPGDLSAAEASEVMNKLFEDTKNITFSSRAASSPTLEQPEAESAVTIGLK